MKEWALFIAYRTSASLFGSSNRRFGQFDRARNLVSLNVSIHILQVLCLLNFFFVHLQVKFGIEVYLFLLLYPMLVGVMLNPIFTKAVLAKGIAKYTNTTWAKTGRLIGYLYLFGNFVVLSWIIFYCNSKVWGAPIFAPPSDSF